MFMEPPVVALRSPPSVQFPPLQGFPRQLGGVGARAAYRFHPLYRYYPFGGAPEDMRPCGLPHLLDDTLHETDLADLFVRGKRTNGRFNLAQVFPTDFKQLGR